MRAHQVDLQLTNLIAGNAHVAQLAHASRNSVSDLVAGDDFVDDGASLVHYLTRVRREQGSAPVFNARDFGHRFQCQIVAVDVECVQKGSL